MTGQVPPTAIANALADALLPHESTAVATAVAYAIDPHPAVADAEAAADANPMQKPREVLVTMPLVQGTSGPAPYAAGSVPCSRS